MKVDKLFCMNCFLMYRSLYPYEYSFDSRYPAKIFTENEDRIKVYDSYELEERLRLYVEEACDMGHTALALSGGIDSAILAKFMPPGTTAYTFKCVVPGVQVVDETERAALYAKECGLKHYAKSRK